MLKIALVIFHADPSRGGAERYTFDLADALRARGHHVATLAARFGPRGPLQDDVALNPGRGSRLRRYNRFLDLLDAHLAKQSYDVVHAMLPVRRCDLYHPHAGIAAEAIASGHLKHETPMTRALSRVANQINLKRRRFAQVERGLLTGPRPPVVICLSQYVQRGLLRHYALADSRLATLFNAIDLARFSPYAPSAAQLSRTQFKLYSEQVIALMIAQDFARKGLAEAIAAVSQVQDHRLVLLVVGKQKPDRYRAMAEKLGVAGRVIFAGPSADPVSFYRMSDLFVLPTRHDPCSLVVLEALAMGLPVISTAFNGACEIMENGRHGFILPDPRDSAALAEAMRRLLNDENRKAMSRECLDLRPMLAYERHLDDLVAIYESARRG